MGGSSAPAVPAPPSPYSMVKSWNKALPIMYQGASQYEPKFAALEKSIQSQLNPYITALPEELAKQAMSGMTQEAPSWYKSQVADTLKSQLGRNLVYNPQGQEQFGVKTQQAYREYGDYFRNLGMAISGRQPLAQPNNYASTFTPGGVMNYNAQTYPAYASASMQAESMASNPWANLAGTVVGAGLGKWMGGWGGK